jgi:hypothetical protein
MALDLRDREFFKQLLEAVYLAKFLQRPPRFVPPLDSPLGSEPQPQPSEPQPQPNSPAILDSQRLLLGELLIHTLNSSPNVSSSSIIGEIRESGVQAEVLQDLISRLETATKLLKSELSGL